MKTNAKMADIACQENEMVYKYKCKKKKKCYLWLAEQLPIQMGNQYHPRKPPYILGVTIGGLSLVQ